MADSHNGTAASGIGFPGLLGIVFITLKLLGKIDWSWWWVTCPLWAVPAMLVVVGVVALLILLVQEIYGAWFGRKSERKG